MREGPGDPQQQRSAGEGQDGKGAVVGEGNRDEPGTRQYDDTQRYE